MGKRFCFCYFVSIADRFVEWYSLLRDDRPSCELERMRYGVGYQGLFIV